MSVLEIHNKLKIPVFFFTLLLFFQLITGFLLFHTHIGWTHSSVLEFYKMNSSHELPMSFETFLQTAAPHLISMGMISFLVIHFLTFVTQVRFRWRWTVAISLAFFTILDIFAGVFVLYISSSLWWLKILAFWGFQFSFFSGTLMMLASLTPLRQLQSEN